VNDYKRWLMWGCC